MKRILTAFAIIIVCLPILIYSDTVVFPIALTALAVIADYELFHAKNIHKKLFLIIPSVLFSSVMPLFVYFHSGTGNNIIAGFAPMVLVAFFLIFILEYKKTDLSEMIFAFFSTVLIGFSFMAFQTVCSLYPRYYLLLIICPCCTDIAALYAGKLFGKKKLCPDISPKKTIAGAIGGLVGSCIGMTLFYLAVKKFVFNDFNLMVFPVAIALSVASQFGDLSASTIKRYFGIKDYGKILPGHGGVLDRLDSILASAVCAYVFITIAAVFKNIS